MTPVNLTLAAVAALAAAGAAKRRRGERNVDSYKVLSRYADQPHEGLAEYYPDTARGKLKPHRTERVFYAGYGYRKIGYTGPADGTMVPVEARYVVPRHLNIFSGDKLSALVESIRDGDQPIVNAGYGFFSIVDRSDIRESREYAGDHLGDPYDDDDLGELTVQIRDGNHRTFAALVAGAPFTWVKLSDSDKKDIFNPDPSRKREMDKLYRAIRKAQREAGAPLLTKSRKPRGYKKAQTQLQVAEAREKSIDDDIHKIQVALLRELDEYNKSYSFLSPERREKEAGLYLYFLMEDLQKEDFRKYMEIRQNHPLHKALEVLESERAEMSRRLYDLRKAAGVRL
jgi:hypothetical protein